MNLNKEPITRRALLRKAGNVVKVAAAAEVVESVAPVMAAVTTGVGLILNTRGARVASAAEQGCKPLPTDGRPPLCATTDSSLYAQSRFGGHYFEDKNGNGLYEPEVGDEAIQGVKGRQILVEEIAFAGWGDFLQINPGSRKVYPDGRVSYMDIKAGNNSGERFVDRWTIFRIPEDPAKNIGIGYDLRTGSERLYVSVAAGSQVDKVWAPIEDEKRYERHECSGNCGWNCVKFVQYSRLVGGANINLGETVPNTKIHVDQNNGKISSFTDFLWLWASEALSESHIDYNRINTPLTDALRRSEQVVKSSVFIPKNTVSYENYTR